LSYLAVKKPKRNKKTLLMVKIGRAQFEAWQT